MPSILSRVCWVGIVGVLLTTPGQAGVSKEYVFFHENVMGTSLELRVLASSQASADRTENLVLQEIDRLAAIFSGYESSSEFRRWQDRQAGPVQVSRELFAILKKSDEWRERSGGAFDPRVQVLSALWARGEKLDRIPSDQEIAKTIDGLRQRAWALDLTSQTAERIGSVPLSLNAIAKGEIVERASEFAMGREPGISGLLLNVGGDMRVCGEKVGRVGIIDPNTDSESSQPIATIEVRNRAVATSSRSQRGFRINGEWYSHIFDPRMGRPADKVAGATVIARSSADADALATILNVLSPEEGIKLVDSRDDTACLIVGRDGAVTQSRTWERHLAFCAVSPLTAKNEPAPELRADEKAWDPNLELGVDFEINNPDGNNRRYRRPYVAIWVEDKEGKPVRTITLWLSQGGAGPDRWLPDMKRWYVVNQTVKKEKELDLVHTMARATRQPGKYSAVWDGKDDKGQLVPLGEYTISIEAAREHGTYQIIRKTITLAGKPFDEELKGNVEIKSASLSYRRKAAPKQP